MGHKGNPNDIVITVMGPTGSGKTNFINAFIGGAKQPGATSSLKSDTQSVTPYAITYRDRRLVLVDTPGFDDAYRPDTDIVIEVTDWLNQKYTHGATLQAGGIIYLHRISANRVTGSVHKNIQTFARRCGNLPIDRVRLVTTMWDTAKDQAVADRREKELTGECWRKLLEEGAVSERFDNTQPRARDIIDDLLSRTGEAELGQQNHLNKTEVDKPASANCFSRLWG